MKSWRAAATNGHEPQRHALGDADILPGKGAARDEALRNFYKTIIQIRAAHPALRRKSGLITEAEYQQKRADVVKGL